MTLAEEQLHRYLSQVTAMMRQHNPRATPDNYISIHDYVCDRGVAASSEPLTAEELAIVMRATEHAELDGMGFEAKQCFANAARLVLADDTNTLEYTEGFAQGSVMPCAHAWASIHGKVVDLTWRTQPDETPRGLPGDHHFQDRVVGAIPTTRAYRGVSFERAYLRKRVLDTGFYTSLIDDYQAGWPLLQGSRRSPPPELP